MKSTLLSIAVFFATVAMGQNSASLANFEALKRVNGVELSWTALNETDITNHEIQKSANGTSFTNIGNVTAQNNGSPYSYNFIDATPVEGNKYYRLRSVDKQGNAIFSAIIQVDNGFRRRDVRVLPNPVQGGVMNLQLSNISSGKYIISLYSNAGQKVFARSQDLSEGSTTETINLPTNLSKGIYFLQFTDGQMRINKQVLVQ